MPNVTEVDALSDFGLTLDHFYGFVKKQVSNLQVNQYVQLQATAIPLDVSLQYPWFSFGNLNSFFDIRLDPTPVADNITMLAGSKLSIEYIEMVSQLLKLVEYKQLDSQTNKEIDSLQTRINNNQSRINSLLRSRMDDWVIYTDSSMIDRGDISIFNHWCQGYYATREINDLQYEQTLDQSRISALRLREYKEPSHRSIVEAYAAATGPSARLRYPRFPDQEYKEEASKFNPVYFANLPDNDSSLFANRQLMSAKESLTTITSGSIGNFSDTITKHSSANSSITTDWSASGNFGYGPFRFSANVNSHQKIKQDFSSTQNIVVGAKSLQAVPIDASSWFRPDIFNNELLVKNRNVFEKYFGLKGSLLYHPTHLIIARGFNVKFSSSQNWQYDYESDLSSSGSASARIFGIGWGGGGKYSQSIREQKVETRGHDLILDDGENIRILGYIATKNTYFLDNNSLDMERILSSRFEI